MLHPSSPHQKPLFSSPNLNSGEEVTLVWQLVERAGLDPASPYSSPNALGQSLNEVSLLEEVLLNKKTRFHFTWWGGEG